MLCNRWHRAIAQTSGDLVLSMVRHKMTRGDLMAYAETLEMVADEMRRFASGEKLTETGFMKVERRGRYE
jgi:hypothetical protein